MYTVINLYEKAELGLRIGSVEIEGYAALAPMAGVADRAFRQLCFGYGTSFVVGEMVSAKGLTYGDRKSADLLLLDDECRPAAIQLFGDDPETMARAAVMALEYKPDWIDINFGCPAPKIAGNHAGSALMREPDLCRRIVQAIKDAVPIPVTAKIRKGYSKDEINAVDVALACEAGGADAVTVHGRTRDQMYAPPVDVDVIRQVKRALSIPVIGNGDVTDALSAKKMYEYTECDMIMIGRAALGAPWIFEHVKAYMTRGELLPSPNVSERMSVLLRQVSMMVKNKGEHVGMLEARKHAAWYMNGMRGAAAFRREAGMIKTYDDLKLLCDRVVTALEREGAGND